LVLFVVDATGTGAFASVQIIYFSRVLHLTASGVSVGLSVAGFAGLLFVLPLGRLADRRSPRWTLLVLHVVLAGSFCMYLLPLSPVAFAVVSCSVLTTQRVISPIRRALISQIFGDARVRVSAKCRVASNVAFAAGGLIAAGVTAVGDSTALKFLLLADAASFAVCGVLALRLRVPANEHHTAGRALDFIVLRDRRYLLAALINIFASVHDTALFVVLPLWILHRTEAPLALIPVVAVVNGVAVVCLQLFAAKSAESIRGALRAQTLGVFMFAAGCVLVAFSAATGKAGSVALVLAGCLALTGAEVWQSAGGWGLSYSLARSEHMAQYQSLFGLSTAAQESLGPVAMTALVLGFAGATGWVIVAALVVAIVVIGSRPLWPKPSGANRAELAEA
jgi:predicted MFS family arabinose efflux permease